MTFGVKLHWLTFITPCSQTTYDMYKLDIQMNSTLKDLPKITVG